jgi:hypothetical protein
VSWCTAPPRLTARTLTDGGSAPFLTGDRCTVCAAGTATCGCTRPSSLTALRPPRGRSHMMTEPHHPWSLPARLHTIPGPPRPCAHHPWSPRRPTLAHTMTEPHHPWSRMAGQRATDLASPSLVPDHSGRATWPPTSPHHPWSPITLAGQRGHRPRLTIPGPRSLWQGNVAADLASRDEILEHYGKTMAPVLASRAVISLLGCTAQRHAAPQGPALLCSRVRPADDGMPAWLAPDTAATLAAATAARL